MTIKTLIRAAVLGCALSAGLAGIASAAEPAAVQSSDGYDRHVRIYNNTGWTMLRFYASDARETSWQEDILGRGTLSNGANININIDDGSGACVYDFKAEFTNGQELTRYGINVCQISNYYYTR